MEAGITDEIGLISSNIFFLRSTNCYSVCNYMCRNVFVVVVFYLQCPSFVYLIMVYKSGAILYLTGQ